jgi:hypothetical protein
MSLFIEFIVGGASALAAAFFYLLSSGRLFANRFDGSKVVSGLAHVLAAISTVSLIPPFLGLLQSQSKASTATVPITEQAPQPPPPPRFVDCTPEQKLAVGTALNGYGQKIRDRDFISTTFVDSKILKCQLDNESSNLVVLGYYAFRGGFNNDEFSFTVNYSTDIIGGSPSYSNYAPDDALHEDDIAKQRTMTAIDSLESSNSK